MALNTQSFSEILEELIKFRTGTTKLPIKDTSWEELIWASLVFMYGEDNVNWDSQSHKKSVDVEVKINGDSVNLSAKGGVIKKDNLSVSSYRLTTFPTLEEKLDFIKKQHKSFDFYLICAREIDKRKQLITYSILKVGSEKLAPSYMLVPKNWKKTKYGYELRQRNDFFAKIVSKMSDQLWYSIPLTYFSKDELLIRISLSSRDLGKGLIDFLKNNKSLESFSVR